MVFVGVHVLIGRLKKHNKIHAYSHYLKPDIRFIASKDYFFNCIITLIQFILNLQQKTTRQVGLLQQLEMPVRLCRLCIVHIALAAQIHLEHPSIGATSQSPQLCELVFIAGGVEAEDVCYVYMWYTVVI